MSVFMASDVLLPERSPQARATRPNRPMKKAYLSRFSTVILAFATLTSAVLAVVNFRAELAYQVPSDGVWWVEHEAWLRAEQVQPGGAGERAGIRAGDELAALNGNTVNSVAALQREMHRTGVWSKATYSLVRRDVPLDVNVILTPADKSLNIGLRLIALAYLFIGLYVLLRRWGAPRSLHFYIFCLVSFVFYAFHFTGKLNQFDWIIYWS